MKVLGVDAGFEHTCAVFFNYDLRQVLVGCWGYNELGQCQVDHKDLKYTIDMNKDCFDCYKRDERGRNDLSR